MWRAIPVMMIIVSSIVLVSCVDVDSNAGSKGRVVNPSEQQIRVDPITIAASSDGDFSSGFPWYLSVNSSGAASLTIETVPEIKVIDLDVEDQALAKLRESIIENKFFLLQNDYGGSVPSGSSQTVAITIGQCTKSVTLRYLMNHSSNDIESRNEMVRAINVRQIVRSWFEDASAVDLRPFDQPVRKQLLDQE